jgi:hypothetical protein
VEADGVWQQERSSRDALALATVHTGPDPCWILQQGANFFDSQAEPVSHSGLLSLVFQMNFYLLENRQQEASMSKCKPISIATTLAFWLLSGTSVLYGQQAKTETSIENIFQMGAMAQDTNGDQMLSAVM